MSGVEALTHGERLGAFGAALSFDALPRDVVEKVKLHLLDMTAVAFAFANDPLAHGLAAMAGEGEPDGVATIFGFVQRTSAKEAAFVNGSLAHGKDFDDVHVASITHPTVAIAPAVLALAESMKLDGRAVIVAATFGIEVCVRLGLSGGAAMARRGIPPMTTCGTLGAAAAAAQLIGLDARGIAAAIGVAGSMASGSHEWTSAGTNAKLTTPGWAARNGVIAAQMAAQGFDGSMSAIEGRKGLMIAMAGTGAFDEKEPSADLGQRWETRNLAVKRFASCQGTQPYIGAALRLRSLYDINPETIEAIEIVIGSGVGLSLTEPLAMKQRPRDGYAAKFGIPFCTALALHHGEVRLSHFEADWGLARDAFALADKVSYLVDTSFDVGAADLGLVRVRLVDGRTLEATENGSQVPAGIEAVCAKFTDCAGGYFNAAEREAITAEFMNLEFCPDIGLVMRKLGVVHP